MLIMILSLSCTSKADNQIKTVNNKTDNHQVSSKKDIPDKIRWYENNICYYLQSQVTIGFIIIEKDPNTGRCKLLQKEDSLPIEEIAYIQSSWAFVYTGGICLFSGFDGVNKNKNPNLSTFNFSYLNN